MVTETDRNKARSAVVSAYHALDCVMVPVSFLHAFADAAVDAVSTDAEPVKTAPAVAVKALRDTLEWYGEQARLAKLIHSEGDPGRWALAEDGGKRANAALSAQVQDVAVEPFTEKSTDLTIPEGYVLLPIEPTQAMIMAYNRAGDDLGLSAYPNARIAYDAMVKTAPSASLRNTRDRCGWKLVPKEPLPEQLQTAAFNLSAEYSPEFVLANEAFARDVYAELVAASPASKHGDAE